MDKTGMEFETQLKKKRAKEKVWPRIEEREPGRDRDAQCMHGIC